MKVQSTDLCPCQTGKTFAECCSPLLDGKSKAQTALDLMRSRYTAYVVMDMDYLHETTSQAKRQYHNKKATREWAENSVWKGLEILSTCDGQAEDTEGVVEFVASYQEKSLDQEHHEVASFLKEDGEWFFDDAKVIPSKPVQKAPKIGRNDPCPCGSGKKYKKCCA